MNLLSAIKFVLENADFNDDGNADHPCPSPDMTAARDVLEGYVEIEEDGREYLGGCESCSANIFDGDCHHYTSDGYWLCADHAPMLSDIVTQFREIAKERPFDPRDETAFDSAKEMLAWCAEAEREIAESGDRKAYTNA